MNQYIAIHTHEYGATIYLFRSPLSESELVKKGFDEDGGVHETFADTIEMYSEFEPGLGETFSIHEIDFGKNPIIEELD